MPIIAAYIMPHPPMTVPAVGRGEELSIQRTLDAYDLAAREIADLAPETIVFITPHGTVYSDYFHISPGDEATGDLSKFKAPEVQFHTQYDANLRSAIINLAQDAGLQAGLLGEKDRGLDHGVAVPMWFINRRYNDYNSVRISQSGYGIIEHYKLGTAIAQAAQMSGRKVAFIASGDLSHKLKAEGHYGFSPDGVLFDQAIKQALADADFLKLLLIPDSLRQASAECGYGSLVTLAGCLDGFCVNASFLSYEDITGVGYAIASFIPDRPDKERFILDKFKAVILDEAGSSKDTEDSYREIARMSLECTVKNKGSYIIPYGLPEELTAKKAGVFVSLHIRGRLRGCVGTFMPTTRNIAAEIVQNAVSAGLKDARFDPVTEAELPYITYKVDVLSEPVPVSGPDELDPKIYGVIVKQGEKLGLLLPDLEGIDTVSEQLSIAKRKAGIDQDAAVDIMRFTVERHG